MARKKVKLAWIANDAARRATFKKRRRGLLKKVSELTTLCGVKACVVVYGAGEQQPEVWPSAPEAMRLVSRFKSLPEMEQCKKMMNQEGFIRHNIGKLQEQLRKAEGDVREAQSIQFMYECLAGIHPVGLRGVDNVNEASTLMWVLSMKMKSVQEKMASMSVNDAAVAASASQMANFVAAVDGQLHNPFPLIRTASSAPLFAAGASSAAAAPALPPQNLLTLAKNRMELAAAEAALMQRQNYFAGFGAANRSNHGTLSSIIPNNNQGTINMLQSIIPNNNQGTMNMLQGVVPNNNQGTLNMLQSIIPNNNQGTMNMLQSIIPNNNNQGTMNMLQSIIPNNNNQGTMNMLQSIIPNNNQGTMNMMQGIVRNNNQGTMNMMQGSASGSGGQQQDEMFPPGFEDQQATNLSSWFDGNYSINPSYRSNYNP